MKYINKKTFSGFRILLVLLAGFLTSNLAASEFKSGESVDFTGKLKQDLYVTAGKVNLSVEIAGDMSVIGGDIAVKAKLKDDAMIAGGKVTGIISGSDDVRLAAGQADIAITSTGDVFLFGGEIHLLPETKISGDLFVMGGKVTLDGKISGNVFVRGGDVTIRSTNGKNLDLWAESTNISGKVAGDSRISSRNLKIDSSAKFSSGVEYWSDKEIDFGAAATEKPAYKTELRGDRDYFNWIKFGLWIAFWFAGFVFLGLFLSLRLMPKLVRESADTVLTRTTSALGYGVLFYLGVPVLSVLLMMSVIGIVHGILLLAIYVMLLFVAWPVSAVILTQAIVTKYKKTLSSSGMLFASFGVFFAMLVISGLPVIGNVFCLLAAGITVGAMVMVLMERRRTTPVTTGRKTK